MQFEPVIGLEVHAQLLTASKIFCGCSTAFGAPPNTHVCAVCLGLPGALPVLNRAAVDDAIRAALALGCTIHERSIFARKNYFYPDLPKGYQISQYEQPLATAGVVEFASGGQLRRVGITRVHMEEDAGKSLHEGFFDSDRKTYVDYNRSGVPLIEIVTEPDLRSAADAAEFFTRLRALLVWLGVNDGNMEEGSLRCDANVSVRPLGTTALGTKAEVKNLNSFRFLQKALEYEIERQVERLTGGERVVQETRLWDPGAGRTVSMRSKEEAHDYRYFPEPDLPPVAVDAARLQRIRSEMPELPDARRRRACQGREQLDHGRAGAQAERTASRRRFVSADASTPGRPDRARRERHDQRVDGEGGLRQDVRIERDRGGDCRRGRPGPDRRRVADRCADCGRAGEERGCSRPVPGRQDRHVRVSCRPGDEGGGR
jgi:aspartyl-tRNA(Asn)/glutamyl-tRNA(Gln) amidotransferase subunit B